MKFSYPISQWDGFGRFCAAFGVFAIVAITLIVVFVQWNDAPKHKCIAQGKVYVQVSNYNPNSLDDTYEGCVSATDAIKLKQGHGG